MKQKPLKTEGDELSSLIMTIEGSSILVAYHRSLPFRIRKILPQYVDALRFLIPSWVRSLTFNYQPNAIEDGKFTTPAYSDVQDDYLFAIITLSDNWFMGDKSERVTELMHEFLHLTSAPSFHFGRRALEKLMEEDRGPRSSLILEEYRRRYEASTQEITMELLDKLWPTMRKQIPD